MSERLARVAVAVAAIVHIIAGTATVVRSATVTSLCMGQQQLAAGLVLILLGGFYVAYLAIGKGGDG